MKKTHMEQQVVFNQKGYRQLNEYLKNNNFSKIFVLVDENTHKYCLPSFVNKIKTNLAIELIEMEAGEESKNLETCNNLWNALSELGGDRKSLIINLGGGVVTDLGGFIAATFKRGISCIHFPTTLLAMVDAAVGGKNGINLGGLKNQIGVIEQPKMVIADTSFLQTLPPEEMRSGLAEMLKHGLIQDEDYWKRLSDLSKLNLDDLDELILESVVIKEKVVQQDPTEQHVRKSLNFGHTLGHAIETYFLEEPSKEKILHGEAVAAGMVLAAYLSYKTEGFPQAELSEVKNVITSLYGTLNITRDDQNKIIELLKFDKKNEAGKINFVLLEKIGKPLIDRQVTNELIYESFDYYLGNQ